MGRHSRGKQCRVARGATQVQMLTKHQPAIQRSISHISSPVAVTWDQLATVEIDRRITTVTEGTVKELVSSFQRLSTAPEVKA